jgi:hypothetical protein
MAAVAATAAILMLLSDCVVQENAVLTDDVQTGHQRHEPPAYGVFGQSFSGKKAST